MYALRQNPVPDGFILLRGQRYHLPAVRADRSDRNIVKPEHVLYHLCLLGRNGSLLSSLGEQQPDFLLRHRLLFLLRVNAKPS